MTDIQEPVAPGFGWVRDLPDHRDRIFNLEAKIERAAALPAKFSLRDKMPPVYNQLQLGSCAPHSVCGIQEYREMQQREGTVTPSRLFLYYAVRELEGTVGEDAGSMIRDNVKVAATTGIPPETDWPYDTSQFTTRPPQFAYVDARKHEALQYHRIIPSGLGAPIRTALHMGLPIANGFPVPERFESGWDPRTEALPLPEPGEGYLGGHAVVACGWDYTRTRFPVDVIEERNSWGPDWGDDGYFYVDARWYQPGASLFDDLWVIAKVE